MSSNEPAATPGEPRDLQTSSPLRRSRRVLLGGAGVLLLVLIILELLWMRSWLSRRAEHSSPSAGHPDYAKAELLSIYLTNPVVEQGIQLIQDGDGVTTPAVVEGLECHKLLERKTTYAYFAVAPSFKLTNQFDLEAVVEYFDATSGRLEIHYDAWSRHGDEGRYARTARRLVLTGSREWKTNQLSMPDARLENRQNGGADFRIRTDGPEAYVRRISLRRVAPPREGPFFHSNAVSITLGSILDSQGLALGHDPDSVKFATNAAGQDCYGVRPGPTGSAYLYVKVDPSFKAAHPGDCSVEVEYCSARPCRFRIEYDGLINGKVSEYEATRTVSSPGGSWAKTNFFLPQPRFRNAQNDEADFRLNAFTGRLFIRSVALRPAQPAP